MDDAAKAQLAAMGAACYALQARKTANALARAYNAAGIGEGLEMTQFSTLCAIALETASSTAELARGLGIDRSTLVRNLEILRRKALITSSEKGRGAVHRLTAVGRRTVQRGLPKWIEMQARVEAGLRDAGGPDPRIALRTLRRAVRASEPEDRAAPVAAASGRPG